MTNYTIQDLAGSLLATAIFPIVFLIPGYVIGWLLNVFDFRSRQLTMQHVIGIVLSNAISPVSLFLIHRFTSADGVLILLSLCSIAYLILLAGRILAARTKHLVPDIQLATWYQKRMVLVATIGAILLIILLVDVQIQNRLYFNTASYDLTTRVAVVDAITRTGVPPINPGYYPGHPVQLTYLYYFWYILGSVVDRLGGDFITAYQSMIGSIVWSGLTLASTLALYIQMRMNGSEEKKLQLSCIASQLLLISGLDFIPIAMAVIQERIMFGRLPYNGHLEGWNTPIMSWANAVIWVPHHVASALACITAMILIIYGWRGNTQRKVISSILSGFAFASAFGLSVWIMLTFGVFWVVWLIFLFFQKQRRDMILPMILAGVLGILLASPFIWGIIAAKDPNPSTSTLPIALYVRPFMAIVYFEFLPRTVRLLINIIFLPLNYFFEFGFFMIMAIMWIQAYRKSGNKGGLFQQAELILVATITILLSFVFSTVIVINDLGIRCWLPVQFILVIWTVDIMSSRLSQNVTILNPALFKSFSKPKSLSGLLTVIYTVGLLTSLTHLITIRSWPLLVDLNIVGFPNELSPDTRLGERTYAARQTYNYIQKHIPENTIIQSNPLVILDRPGGLYGDHQMAIADRTSYGVSAIEFKRMIEGIGTLFTLRDVGDWSVPDKICDNYFINAIIIADTDPLWSSVDALSSKRPPIFKNDYYAVFSCGK